MASGEALGQRVAEIMSVWPEVDAVALGGSRAAETLDDASDVDLYVYCATPPSLERRRALTADSPRAELDNRFFEPGDEWIDPSSGIHLDVMYRAPGWIEADLDRVLVRHEAWVGYSTCFWDNVRSSRPLFDRRGWYAGLHARAQASYPEPLRGAIVAKNRPLLAANVSSFAAQLEKAAARGDRISADQPRGRLPRLLLRRPLRPQLRPHPGEKRLLEHAARRCPRRPSGLDSTVRRLLEAAARCDADVGLAARLVASELDVLLRSDELLR